LRAGLKPAPTTIKRPQKIPIALLELPGKVMASPKIASEAVGIHDDPT